MEKVVRYRSRQIRSRQMVTRETPACPRCEIDPLLVEQRRKSVVSMRQPPPNEAKRARPLNRRRFSGPVHQTMVDETMVNR